jgi:hypothetical protein
MNHKSDHIHHLLRNAVMRDQPQIEPDKTLGERLNYYYMLKRPSQKVRSNSFSGMFFWLFSLKSVGFKAGVASFCLAYFLFFGHIKNNPGRQELADTIQIHQALVDTNYVVKDTCK